MSSVIETMRVVEPDADGIGAQVVGIDIKQLESNSLEIEQLRALIYRCKLIVIRGQQLNESQYVEFARKLGRPQVYFQSNYHHPDYPEIFVSSNIPENGRKVGVSRTGLYWHTDCSFEKKPLSWTSVCPQVFPEGVRGTMFINMAKVYRDLPDHLRSYVDGVTAIHAGQLRYKVQASDMDRSLKELLERINVEVPPVEHPAVICHPVTGEKILYINSGFTVQLKGLTYEENQRRLEELFRFIEREENIHTHTWAVGDLIIWDNRYLIHCANALSPGQQSKMFRIGIYDNLPFYVGLEA